jgi:hypothetical protein
VGSRAAAKKREWVGLLSFFSFSLPAPALITTVTCKKHKTQQQVVPFPSRVFLYLHPTDPVFWASLSSLFQVAGKEEDTDQRGVAARYSEHNYQVEIVF